MGTRATTLNQCFFLRQLCALISRSKGFKDMRCMNLNVRTTDFYLYFYVLSSCLDLHIFKFLLDKSINFLMQRDKLFNLNYYLFLNLHVDKFKVF